VGPPLQGVLDSVEYGVPLLRVSVLLGKLPAVQLAGDLLRRPLRSPAAHALHVEVVQCVPASR